MSEYSYHRLASLLPGTFRIKQAWREAEKTIDPVFPFETILHALPADDAVDEVRAYALAAADGKKIQTPVYLGRTEEDLPDSFVLDRPGGRRHYRWRLTDKPPKVTQLEDKLKKLRARMTDPDTRFALSLGGGGLRLFAHAAAFKILNLIGRPSEIDEVWGCSGGAIAGLVYSLGVSPQAMEREGYDLYNERYDLLLSPSKTQVLKNLAVDLALPSNPFALKGFMDIQETIQEIVARLDKENKLKLPFYAIAYNLHKKRNEVLTPLKVHKRDYGDFIHTVPAIDAVLASSSIPILYVPRVIKKGKSSYVYVDGGTAEEVPLVSVYRKWNLDRRKALTDKKKLFVLAVNLFPQVSGWKIFRNRLFRRLPFVDILKWSSHLADLMRRARIEDHLQTLREDPNVEVWELVLPFKGAGVLDPKTIPKVIASAHSNFVKQLLAWESGKPTKF